MAVDHKSIQMEELTEKLWWFQIEKYPSGLHVLNKNNSAL